MGRGGSDLTASVVGAGIPVTEIQIWTDVDGLLTCDPRVLHGGYRVRSLSYEEAEEMARLGAKVLCPKTVVPAIRQNIPLVIRNSRHPEVEGTLVWAGAVRKPGSVKAIACKTGMTVVHLFVPETGILPVISHGLNDLFERNQLGVEMVQAQADGVSFAVQSTPRLPELLRDVAPSVRISVEEDTAVISLIGEGITAEPAVLKRGLVALLKNSAVRMTSQGGSQKSLSFAVPEAKLAISVENLHREFFRVADPEIFVPTSESERRPVLASPQNRGVPDHPKWSPQPRLFPVR